MPEEFRAEMRRIARGPEPLAVVDADEPRSRGWLRRPEHDIDELEAWERPDGSLCRIVRRPEQ